MAPDRLALRWRSEKRGGLVSHVKPGEAVRVESLESGSAGQTVQIFRIPEPWLRRLIYKVAGRAGFPQVPLQFAATGPAGPLSERWNAAQFPPPLKPTRYVALAPGLTSGPLIVTDKVIIEANRAAGGKVGVDGAAAAALTGVPVPLRLDANGSRRTRLQTVAYGIVDPSVEPRWMTTGAGGRPIQGYLEQYLSVYAEAGGLSFAELWGALEEEYRDCFEGAAEVGAEFVPGAFEIGEGESVEVDLDLYPQTAGRTLAAVGLADAVDGALLTVSDLMVVTFTEEGLLFVDP